MRFFQSAVDMGDVPYPESNRVGIEALVRKVQHLGIADGEITSRGEAFGAGALGAFRYHLGRDVGNGDVGAGTAGASDAEGDIPGAACDVDDPEIASRLRGRQQSDEIILPQTMEARRHQI